MKINTTILVFVSLLVGVMVYSWWSTPLIVTVQGTGEIKVPPTHAVISFQISEINQSAVTAISNLQSRAQAMRQVLVQNGVKSEDVVESQPRVVPSSLVATGTQGFTATMTMGGKTSQVAQAPVIAAALYEKGATLVAQPVLAVNEAVTYEDQAFKQALDDAKKQANRMASKNFKFFKKIASITQTTSAEGTITSRSAESNPLQAPVTPQTDNLTIAKVVEVTYRMW